MINQSQAFSQNATIFADNREKVALNAFLNKLVKIAHLDTDQFSDT